MTPDWKRPDTGRVLREILGTRGSTEGRWLAGILLLIALFAFVFLLLLGAS